MQHPDFAVLTVSWELALRADGYADNTVKAYQNAVRSLADWLAEHHPEVGPAELERQHVRGWLVEVRERHSPRMPTCGPCFPPAPGPTSRPAGTRPSSCCSWTAGCGSQSRPASRSPTSTCGTGSCSWPEGEPSQRPPAPGGPHRGQGGPGAGSLPARTAPAPVRGHAAAMAW